MMNKCVICGQKADGLFDPYYCRECEEILAKFYDVFFGGEES